MKQPSGKARDLKKFLSISDELDASCELIKAGFGALQEIDMANTFYHLPHQLLASGFERLMKCYILLVHAGSRGSYPNTVFLKSVGHDLNELLQLVCKDYYGGKNRPLIKEEFDYLTTDRILHECMRILSLFGMKGRYYNLDVVTDEADPCLINPTEEWQDLESEIEDPGPYLSDQEALYRDYFPRVHRTMIAKMERLVRAVALQFTLGDHADPDRHLAQLWSTFGDFRHLDTELGTTDYRRSVRILQQDTDRWIKRSDEEILSSDCPTRVVTRDEYREEWPFRADQVIIECRDRVFCIVNITGYAFALNGAARSRYSIPDVHAAGLAVIGKSIGPFLDLARTLRDPSE